MKKITIFTTILTLWTAPFAYAQNAEWFKSDELNARLVVGSDNDAVLQIDLADGWHTYWRIPGDSGLPPVFSWADSQNIQNVEISWPAPTRKKEYEFYTFGYSNSLNLPLSYTPIIEGDESNLYVNAQIMICNDVCIPHRFEAYADITEEDKSAADELIADAKSKLPKTDFDAGLKIESIIAAKDALVVSIASVNGFEDIDIFPVIEEEKLGLANPPIIEISEHDPGMAMVKITAPLDIENLAEKLQGKTLSVTLKKGDQSIVKSVQY